MPGITHIALVDDHIVVRNALAAMINSFDGYHVTFEANHGKDFIMKLDVHDPPDIVLLDVSMPVMNGYETAEWIRKHLPDAKVLVLTFMDAEPAIIRMLKAGARGYIVKESDDTALKDALNNLRDHGFYINELVSNKMLYHSNNPSLGKEYNLSQREITFLKLVCTGKTYKEIAGEMGVGHRTVDSYRDALFAKIGVNSRTGLVIYAIKNGIVKIDELKE